MYHTLFIYTLPRVVCDDPVSAAAASVSAPPRGRMASPRRALVVMP
jgi:hypothetical protein